MLSCHTWAWKADLDLKKVSRIKACVFALVKIAPKDRKVEMSRLWRTDEQTEEDGKWKIEQFSGRPEIAIKNNLAKDRAPTADMQHCPLDLLGSPYAWDIGTTPFIEAE